MKTILTSIALLLGGFLYAQDQVILTVGEEKIYKSEFEAIFKKNNSEAEITREALDEYAELFINFKLKVAEAVAQGLDTSATFLEELEGYRKQLARPYLTDEKVTEKQIQETFERSREEIRAAHILLMLKSNATPADTLAAYQKMMDIKQKVESGESFTKMAKKYSEEPNARQSGGDLGYFSAMQMVYPFETGAYNTPTGEISEIVRTRFGYHLIKVMDRRPARGHVKVRHILISNSKAKEQKVSGREKAEEILDSIKAGADFSAMAAKYSDDKTTSSKGGELPWFGTGQMVESFENKSFQLEVGALSSPVQTTYGWHIIEKLDERPLADFDKILPKIKNKITRDAQRRGAARKSFIAKLKEEGEYVFNEKNLKIFHKYLDTTVFNGEYSNASLAKKVKDKAIVNFDGNIYSQKDLYRDITKAGPQSFNPNLADWLSTFLETRLDKWIIDIEDSRLAEKYPEFAMLYKEYHDGILLFELTSNEVWNKAVEDTTGLEAFFNNNRELFVWKERMDASIYRLKSEALAKKAKKLLKKGKAIDDIRKVLNEESQLNSQIESNTFEKGTKPELDSFEWKTGVSETKEINGLFVFLDVKEILAPSQKEFKDAKGAAIAKYQEHLEKEWIKTLRSKYNFELNKDVLYTVQ